MSDWWDAFVHSLATRQFALVVMQMIVWVAMTVVWVTAFALAPDGWRLFLAVVSTILAVFWTGIFVRARQLRREGGSSHR
ncbi:hypothetical protein [Microbacterium aquimaris]|uniref:DUF2530 domain-containing protein n=1 Tax=Microbacterium aquimaris TaxID=459816 RepID=A0ABU5N6W3_9MICO|nr:hypothetical protein [Microbacterium aquimaris]MDZ8161831.1 hypothetical protein [Microbacterium aquimaris]